MTRGWLLVLALAGCDEVFDLVEVRPSPAASDAQITDPSLIAWFPMETAANGRLEDIAGDHDGTCGLLLCPSPTLGIVGNALLFDGTDQVINTPSPEAMKTGTSFTVAVWARLDRVPTADDYGCVVSKVYGTTVTNSWQVCWAMVSDRWHLYSNERTFDGPQPQYGVWHHFAASWDLATTELRFYYDGLQYGVTMLYDVPFDEGRIVIGGDFDDGAHIGWFPGAIDELRIYNRRLEDAELLQLSTR